MNNPIIAVEGLGKKFCRHLRRSLRYGVHDIVTELRGRNRAGTILRAGEFWALQNISFSLFAGQTLGILGANGAGKSTLLKIINGLIKPDTGSVTVSGRVAPLIAVGAGFNPLLTGSENIQLQLALLGIRRNLISTKLKDIVKFADIGDAIDSPTRSYSTGMLARVGFACAAFSDPTVLLIDEVLAVGDIAFRLRCYEKLHELCRNGVSTILVSHNPISIRSVCDIAGYIAQGQMKAFGSAASVLASYESDMHATSPEVHQEFVEMVSPRSDDTSRIEHIDCETVRGEKVSTIRSGDNVHFVISGTTRAAAPRFIVLVRETKSKQTILSFDSSDAGLPDVRTPPSFRAVIKLPHLGLRPGSYFIKVLLLDGNESQVLDIRESAPITITSDELLVQNLYFQPHSWEFQDGH